MGDKSPLKSTIKIEKIDLDNRDYDFTFDEVLKEDIKNLADSIERFGILNPVRLVDGGDFYIIISGRKRIIAAKYAGMDEVLTLVYDSKIEKRHAMTMSLLDNFPHREYTAVEASWVINRIAEDFKVYEDDIIRDFFPLLHLPPSKKILKELLLISELSDEVKKVAHNRRYPIKVLTRWLDFGEDDRGKIAGLISGAHFGTGAATEILNLLSDLTTRDGTSVRVILENDEIKAIIDDENLSQNEKGERLREALRRLRYPMLSELEQNFKKYSDSLKMPGGAKITHPPYFEGDTLELKISFKDKKGLKYIGQFIVEASKTEEMDRLLEMI